jgi:Kef-type K+ transport system membrane component KefB
MIDWKAVVRVLALTLLLEVVMIGLAFGWVAFYSYLIHPGEVEAYYSGYAQVASPIVSLIAGPAVFGVMARILRSRGSGRSREVWIVLAAYLILDILVVLFAAEDVASNLLFWVPSGFTKAAGVWIGARFSRVRHA